MRRAVKELLGMVPGRPGGQVCQMSGKWSEERDETGNGWGPSTCSRLLRYQSETLGRIWSMLAGLKMEEQRGADHGQPTRELPDTVLCQQEGVCGSGGDGGSGKLMPVTQGANREARSPMG